MKSNWACRPTRKLEINLLWCAVFLLLVQTSGADTPSSAASAPPMAAAGSDVTQPQMANYRLNAGDVVDITIVGETNLPLDYRVSASGTISFPYVGTVNIKGKTPAQVEKLLHKELIDQDYFVDPQVVVFVKEYIPQTVSVIGAVNKPTVVAIPIDRRLDIVEAIASAGGLDPKASKGKITVYRQGKAYHFTLNDLEKVTDPSKKFWLQPQDEVDVGESVF